MQETPIILTKNTNYTLYKYKNEDDLEKMVVEHAQEIFGKNSIYFDLKRKISSKAGLGTIPDGYVIDLDKRKLYVIEVELISHSLKRHILPQISNFIMALNQQETVEKLVNEFYEQQPNKDELTKEELAEIVLNWGVVIIIDEIGDPAKGLSPLLEVVDFLAVHGEVKAIPFKTFVKNNKFCEDHIHSFHSFTKQSLQKEAKKWTFKWETVDEEKHLEHTSDHLKKIFLKISNEICCIAPEIKEVHRKKWITYQISALKNFCTIKIIGDKECLEISLKMKDEFFNDPRGLCRDIKRTPAWTFDKVIKLQNLKDIGPVVKIIKQAHKTITEK